MMPHYATKKRFGQNFLSDAAIIQRIVQALHPTGHEPLVEIGPGLGALTLALLPLQPKLTIVEIDNDLVAFWQAKQKDYPDLHIHHQDALAVDFSAFGSGQKLRLIGNLPYNISTPLLFHLFDFTEGIKDMHFMLQKEVVDRLVAQPNSKDYGRLSVMAQYYCHIDKLFEVPASAFKPAPKVTSAVCRLQPKTFSERYPVEPAKLAQVLRVAFSLRRKTLSNALKSLLTVEQIKQAGIDPGLRPENLSLQDFCHLAEFL